MAWGLVIQESLLQLNISCVFDNTSHLLLCVIFCTSVLSNVMDICILTAFVFILSFSKKGMLTPLTFIVG